MKKKMIFIMGMSCLLLVGCSTMKDKPKDFNASGVASEAVVTAKPVHDTKIVVPLPAKLTDTASADMPDGEYSVSFQSSELKKKGKTYQLEMEFFNYDTYAIEDVDSLVAKDVIEVRGEEIYVKSIAWNKDRKGKVFGVDINGGTEEDGVSLRLEEDCYRTTSLDDYPLYYSIGTATIPLSEELVVQDCIEYDTLPDGVITGYKELPKNITENQPEFWTEANTVVSVKEGKVVKIHRNWTP